MTFPRARVLVSLCLFVAWLGFLFYLVLERRTIVVSQPQFLISQAIVVVEVRDGAPDAQISVKDVLWSADAKDRQLKEITLADLGHAQGYQGAGVYVVPLRKREGRFSITPLPTSRLRIYPWNAETRTQVDVIIASKG